MVTIGRIQSHLTNSFFMQKIVEYLGYQLTSILGPQPKKIEAMDRILFPTSSK